MTQSKDPVWHLTDRQRRYAELVTSGGSQADAFRAAYDASEQSSYIIHRETVKLNNNPFVSAYANHLRNEAGKALKINREFMVRWHWLRMTYDPAELTSLIVGACRFCNGDGHQYQWRLPEYQEAIVMAERAKEPLPDIAGGFGYSRRHAPHPDCPKCDGAGIRSAEFADTSGLSEAGRAAFEGVKETRNGIEVMMADKSKAAEALAKLLGWDVQEVKVLAEFPSPEQIAAMGVDEVMQAYKRLMGG